MGRNPREDFEGAWHHVMNRGADHMTIFPSDDDRRLFLNEVHRAFTAHGLDLHGYCLMGTHFHLLARSAHGTLSAGLHQLSTRFSQQSNSRHGRDGPLFRARFRSKLIETDAQLISTLRYIHRNPVDAGLVEKAVAWPWSSAPAYCGRIVVPGWLVTSKLIEIWPEIGME
jgi:putative transposase